MLASLASGGYPLPVAVARGPRACMNSRGDHLRRVPRTTRRAVSTLVPPVAPGERPGRQVVGCRKNTPRRRRCEVGCEILRTAARGLRRDEVLPCVGSGGTTPVSQQGETKRKPRKETKKANKTQHATDVALEANRNPRR